MTNADFSLLQKPQDTKIGFTWFQQIADLLLNNTTLNIAGQAHRLLEIEFYYNGPKHPDPFAHGDPIQKTQLRWYFHRDEGSYRGGSFKGLDISFGSTNAFGGILIRTIEKPDGSLVNGCSLCVDHILATTNSQNVAQLDAQLGSANISDSSKALHLLLDPSVEQRTVLTTARVGLTLKRAYKHKDMPEFIMKPYRFQTRPRDIKKGRIHTVIALHKAGRNLDAIHAESKSPKRSIQGYLENYEAGTQLEKFEPFYGKTLKTADLCQLHGLWHKSFDHPPQNPHNTP